MDLYASLCAGEGVGTRFQSGCKWTMWHWHAWGVAVQGPPRRPRAHPTLYPVPVPGLVLVSLPSFKPAIATRPLWLPPISLLLPPPSLALAVGSSAARVTAATSIASPRLSRCLASPPLVIAVGRRASRDPSPSAACLAWPPAATLHRTAPPSSRHRHVWTIRAGVQVPWVPSLSSPPSPAWPRLLACPAPSPPLPSPLPPILLTRLAPGHVFGKPTRKEFCYDNLHISRNAWDTNLVKVPAGRRPRSPGRPMLMPSTPPGQPVVPLGQLGRLGRRRLCRRPSGREGQAPRPDPPLPRPHGGRPRH